MADGSREPLELLRAHAPEFRSRFGVQRLSVFGSWARGGATPKSDCDLLVDFAGPATFDGYFDLKFRLEELLGMKVDLVIRQNVKTLIRERIESEAVDVA